MGIVQTFNPSSQGVEKYSYPKAGQKNASTSLKLLEFKFSDDGEVRVGDSMIIFMPHPSISRERGSGDQAYNKLDILATESGGVQSVLRFEFLAPCNCLVMMHVLYRTCGYCEFHASNSLYARSPDPFLLRLRWLACKTISLVLILYIL